MDYATIDGSGGLLPGFWCLSHGESIGVEAIASDIVCVTSVIWNGNTDDNKISRGQTFAGSTVVFPRAYRKGLPRLNILEYIWTTKSVPDVLEMEWVLNAVNGTTPVAPRSIMGGNAGNISPPSPRNAHSTVMDSASTVSEFNVSTLDERCTVTHRQPHGSRTRLEP
ncbi:hypothetical protein FRC09_000572 [Ceratobasidium sp. 395]|nr:hypothetical protein FRC09_000572 [Ceratobasidium sp. 395]